MSAAKNKTKKNYKLIAGIGLVLFYIVYNFLFTCHLDIEIFNIELEKMMSENLVKKVVCVKNEEIVKVYVKNDSIYDCIDILNKIRGGINVLDVKNGFFDHFRGIFAKTKKVSFFMVVPSVYVFDKNFKLIESNLNEDQRIGYEVSTHISWLALIMKGISTIFTLFFLYYILLSIGLVKGGKGALGGVFGFGSKGKLFDKNDKNRITFKDIAGLSEPKMECKEIVDLMNNTKKLDNLGGKMPKGILLVGPPGNGKTLLARAIAGECDATFFYISGADIGGIFYGVGVAQTNAIFKSAKECSRAVIFIDEIDSIGRARSSLRSNDDQENTLNALLVQMDGFEPNSGILVIGSTNRLDILDKALIRPGRFDVKILIDKPVLKERIEILELYINKLKVDKNEIDIDSLAKQTVSFSAAEIANMCNYAALLAVSKNKDKVEWVDFQESFDRVVAGLRKKSRQLSDLEKEMVANHEAGHIIVSWYLKNAHPLLKVTIISRGYALGYAQYTPDEKFITTREEMIDELCTYLGGRCSEELIYNTMSTGASNDLEHVYKIAFNIITIFGMNEKIGRISYGEVLQNNQFYSSKPFSEATAKSIDEEIKKLVDKCYVRVKALLTAHIADLKKISEELCKNEELTKGEVEKLIGPRGDFFE